MDPQRSKEIKVGIVTIVGIVLLILGISLGKGMISSSKHTIIMRFPSSAGLEATAPVTINGVKRGTVETVKPDRGSVLVTASLDDISDIKRDATAMISMLEIIGGKKVEILPGTAPAQFDTKQEMPGVAAADISELIATVSQIGAQAKVLLGKLDTTMTGVNELFADGKMVRQVRTVVDNTEELTTNLNSLVKDNRLQLQMAVRDLNVLLKDLRAAVNVNAPNIEKLVNNLNTTVTKVDGLLVKTDRTLDGAEHLVSDVRGIIGDVKNGKGAVSKLVYDEQFAKKLDVTINELNLLLNSIRKNGINVNAEVGHKP
ncbi:MAG TPA: MlaD family protein [Patescibacteria group bacterium]|nr:MlaD family protein [Patescibacteria group bacterium]